jgi:succinate dehydrogenase flavin-adding protein (antitoxin of CptAB toxin-antitoxin module)
MGESPSPSSPSLLPPAEKGASRGLLELDVVLKNFLDQDYASLSPVEQEAFDKLLAVPDNILWAYVQGSENPPEKELSQIVSKIRK